MSKQRHSLRCQDIHGREVVLTFALTSDRKMIASRRFPNGEPLFLRPEDISQVVNYLRDLQAQALEGETWA